MAHSKKRGSLDVICGSMFSGKSEELIRRINRATYAHLRVAAIKHSLDDRHTLEYVTSHNGNQIKAHPLNNANDLKTIIEKTPEKHLDVLGIDEVQFFSTEIVHTILSLVDQGVRVIAAGLDLDFRGVPFGCMPALLAVADTVTKLKAICVSCGNDAHFTQRLVNGLPAKYTDPIVLIGADEHYQARCRNCYIIDRHMHDDINTIMTIFKTHEHPV
jgi:thymidine kinase